MEAGALVPPEQAKHVPKHPIVGSRPVYTDENSALRTARNLLPIQAKCRVVVRGDQEQGKEFFRRDSPTGSLLGTHVVAQTSSSMDWPLEAMDAENAYF